MGSIGEGQVKWWRDGYQAREGREYSLRPRYRPDWAPSWKQLDKDFFTVEDGQPTLVSIVCQMLPTQTPASVANRNGCNAPAG